MKKRQLKKGVKIFCCSYLLLYFVFIMTTIESIGNTTYNLVLVSTSAIAYICYKLINKYTNIFD